MRTSGWTVFVIIAGLTAAALTLLTDNGALPPASGLVAVSAIPLLVLGAAFVGLIVSFSVITSGIVAVTAIVAPILDVTAHSLAAGNFDDATGYGLWSGLAISGAGLLALTAVVAKRGREHGLLMIV
ncbi:hypothetical protein ET475_11060 [Microbacterium protaetiae]|uniref:Uncharacterized protein n=1 Tax=Microbacterium protaetiae TaxID=2509458 RepID=A0A4V0YDE9_9MICO|nr:hypothetical protein [Microbacterium protaetiae]QAY60471.1 hypothetical protein ET475_11060 [Microbacterium protaetiae]